MTTLHQNAAGQPAASLAAVRRGRITPAMLPRLVPSILAVWRPDPVAPWRGTICLPGPRGEVKVTGRNLLRFFGVQAQGPDAVRESLAAIRDFLRLFAAAHHAAHGKAEEIVALLRGLLDGEGEPPAASAARLLRKARSPQGPAWAAPLRRPKPSADVTRAKWVAERREALELIRRRVPAGAFKKVRRTAALMRHLKPTELWALRQEAAQLRARLRPGPRA